MTDAAATWSQVLAWRWDAQHLRTGAGDPVEVVRALNGVQAQVWSSAVLALSARVPGFAAPDLDRLVWHDRALVKTWAMRGTLHLLPAEDLALWTAMQGLLRPRHEQPSWQRGFGVTAHQARGLVEAVPAVLRGARLTRTELAEAVAARLGEPIEGLGDGFGSLLKPVALAGGLVFGPDAGRNVTFVHPDDWLGPQARVDDPVREVVRRYLRAFGPATREELARWFGTPSAAQAGRWLKACADETATVTVDGRERLLLADDVEALLRAEPSGSVRLLPAFDQWVLTAPRDEPAIVTEPERPLVYRAQGWLAPVVCVDGVVVGTWSRDGKRIEVEPFERPRAAPDLAALDAEVARVGRALR